MDASLQDEIHALQSENKTLRGKIRGYQTLGQLFQEVKEKNRLLENQQQDKEMVSVSTETGPPGPKDSSGDAIPMLTTQLKETTTLRLGGLPWNDFSDLKKSPDESATQKEWHTLNKIGTSMEASIDQLNDTGTNSLSEAKQVSIPIENPGKSEETDLLLREKLEDALQLVEEFERKRANDKKLVKILNEEVKKAKDELKIFKNKFLNLQQENDLMMKKIARLEQERDNFPNKSGAATTVALEVEGAEDWVHLHQETSPDEAQENNHQVRLLQNKCKELEENASRWENEHFNLQMESSKHINDLRSLLESKSKELIKVTGNLNMEKKMLESKFKSLEIILKSEKDAKFEAYSEHQETMRKYKMLENKFLALERKNRNSPMGGMEQNEMSASHVGFVSGNEEQVLMLKQQVSIFKDDFENEKKERLIAQKQSQSFEEKLNNLVRQLEKKEHEFDKYKKLLKDETAKNEIHLQKIYKLEQENKRIIHHNQLLMDKQPKIPVNQPTSVRETPTAPKERTPEMYPNFWSCKICTFINGPGLENCKMCNAQRFSPREKNFPKFTPRWKCKCCTYENNSKSAFCSICKSPKPTGNWDETDGIRSPNKPQEHAVGNNPYDDDDDLAIDGPPFLNAPPENDKEI